MKVRFKRSRAPNFRREAGLSVGWLVFSDFLASFSQLHPSLRLKSYSPILSSGESDSSRAPSVWICAG
jgi:hypothetical protein